MIHNSKSCLRTMDENVCISYAVNKWKNSEKCIEELSEEFNIESHLLYKRISELQPQESSRCSDFVPKSVADALVEWASHVIESGFYLTLHNLRTTTRLLLNDYSETSRRFCDPFNKGFPCVSWARSFIQEHYNLENHFRMFNINNSKRTFVRNYTSALPKFLQENGWLDIVNDKRRVFSANSCIAKFWPVGNEVKTQILEHYSSLDVNEDSDHISVFVNVSCQGELIKPLVVFKDFSVLKHPDIKESCRFLYRHSADGLINRTHFISYLVVFNNWLSDHNIPRPVLLLLDSQCSFVDFTVLTLAKKFNIVLYGLPSSESDNVLPVSVGVFSVLKDIWPREVKKRFVKLDENRVWVDLALKRSLTFAEDPLVIQDAFRTTGLFPFSLNTRQSDRGMFLKRKPSSSDGKDILAKFTDPSFVEEFFKVFNMEKKKKYLNYNDLWNIWLTAAEKGQNNKNVIYDEERLNFTRGKHFPAFVGEKKINTVSCSKVNAEDKKGKNEDNGEVLYETLNPAEIPIELLNNSSENPTIFNNEGSLNTNLNSHANECVNYETVYAFNDNPSNSRIYSGLKRMELKEAKHIQKNPRKRCVEENHAIRNEKSYNNKVCNKQCSEITNKKSKISNRNEQWYKVEESKKNKMSALGEQSKSERKNDQKSFRNKIAVNEYITNNKKISLSVLEIKKRKFYAKSCEHFAQQKHLSLCRKVSNRIKKRYLMSYLRNFMRGVNNSKKLVRNQISPMVCGLSESFIAQSLEFASFLLSCAIPNISVITNDSESPVLNTCTIASEVNSLVVPTAPITISCAPGSKCNFTFVLPSGFIHKAKSVDGCSKKFSAEWISFMDFIASVKSSGDLSRKSNALSVYHDKEVQTDVSIFPDYSVSNLDEFNKDKSIRTKFHEPDLQHVEILDFGKEPQTNKDRFNEVELQPEGSVAQHVNKAQTDVKDYANLDVGIVNKEKIGSVAVDTFIKNSVMGVDSTQGPKNTSSSIITKSSSDELSPKYVQNYFNNNVAPTESVNNEKISNVHGMLDKASNSKIINTKLNSSIRRRNVVLCETFKPPSSSPHLESIFTLVQKVSANTLTTSNQLSQQVVCSQPESECSNSRDKFRPETSVVATGDFTSEMTPPANPSLGKNYESVCNSGKRNETGLGPESTLDNVSESKSKLSAKENETLQTSVAQRMENRSVAKTPLKTAAEDSVENLTMIPKVQFQSVEKDALVNTCNNAVGGVTNSITHATVTCVQNSSESKPMKSIMGCTSSDGGSMSSKSSPFTGGNDEKKLFLLNGKVSEISSSQSENCSDSNVTTSSTTMQCYNKSVQKSMLAQSVTPRNNTDTAPSSSKLVCDDVCEQKTGQGSSIILNKDIENDTKKQNKVEIGRFEGKLSSNKRKFTTTPVIKLATNFSSGKPTQPSQICSTLKPSILRKYRHSSTAKRMSDISQQVASQQKTSVGCVEKAMGCVEKHDPNFTKKSVPSYSSSKLSPPLSRVKSGKQEKKFNSKKNYEKNSSEKSVSSSSTVCSPLPGFSSAKQVKSSVSNDICGLNHAVKPFSNVLPPSENSSPLKEVTCATQDKILGSDVIGTNVSSTNSIHPFISNCDRKFGSKKSKHIPQGPHNKLPISPEKMVDASQPNPQSNHAVKPFSNVLPPSENSSPLKEVTCATQDKILGSDVIGTNVSSTNSIHPFISNCDRKFGSKKSKHIPQGPHNKLPISPEKMVDASQPNPLAKSFSNTTGGVNSSKKEQPLESTKQYEPKSIKLECRKSSPITISSQPGVVSSKEIKSLGFNKKIVINRRTVPISGTSSLSSVGYAKAVNLQDKNYIILNKPPVATTSNLLFDHPNASHSVAPQTKSNALIGDSNTSHSIVPPTKSNALVSHPNTSHSTVQQAKSNVLIGDSNSSHSIVPPTKSNALTGHRNIFHSTVPQTKPNALVSHPNIPHSTVPQTKSNALVSHPNISHSPVPQTKSNALVSHPNISHSTAPQAKSSALIGHPNTSHLTVPQTKSNPLVSHPNTSHSTVPQAKYKLFVSYPNTSHSVAPQTKSNALICHPNVSHSSVPQTKSNALIGHPNTSHSTVPQAKSNALVSHPNTSHSTVPQVKSNALIGHPNTSLSTVPQTKYKLFVSCPNTSYSVVPESKSTALISHPNTSHSTVPQTKYSVFVSHSNASLSHAPQTKSSVLNDQPITCHSTVSQTLPENQSISHFTGQSYAKVALISQVVTGNEQSVKYVVPVERIHGMNQHVQLISSKNSENSVNTNVSVVKTRDNLISPSNTRTNYLNIGHQHLPDDCTSVVSSSPCVMRRSVSSVPLVIKDSDQRAAISKSKYVPFYDAQYKQTFKSQNNVSVVQQKEIEHSSVSSEKTSSMESRHHRQNEQFVDHATGNIKYLERIPKEILFAMETKNPELLSKVIEKREKQINAQKELNRTPFLTIIPVEICSSLTNSQKILSKEDLPVAFSSENCSFPNNESISNQSVQQMSYKDINKDLPSCEDVFILPDEILDDIEESSNKLDSKMSSFRNNSTDYLPPFFNVEISNTNEENNFSLKEEPCILPDPLCSQGGNLENDEIKKEIKIETEIDVQENIKIEEGDLIGKKFETEIQDKIKIEEGIEIGNKTK